MGARARPAPPGGPAEARLARYRAMRDFGRTPEPSGGRPRAGGPPRFVVQKHAATRLHYDFRLELDGVLLSWSVPRGPTLVAGERRLAVRTEDHPLDYAGFEGVIPAGEYGGGTVIVWDRGHWLPEGDAAAALREGRLSFVLQGEKLAGAFSLVRTRLEGGKENWLLIKRRDAEARPAGEIVDQRPASAISGRTIDEVAATPGRVWHSDRAARATPKRSPSARGDRPREDVAAAPRSLAALLGALPVGFPLTNLDKVLYPESGLTKGAVIAYLAAVAEWILPHAGGRPLTLVRCPEGRGRCFFQKHARPGIPAAVGRVAIEEDDGTAQYLRVDDLAGLVAVAQLGSLELHTWGCHADHVERPDLLVFDLDPDPALGWDVVVEAALALRARLAAVELESFVTTTGGKGLHVVAPVRPAHDWEAHKAFANAVVERMAQAAPTRYVTSMAKARRHGRIFLDYLRNGRGATFIAPYSPRAREGATVATPIGWDELERGVDPKAFTIESVPRRLGELAADPWRRIRGLDQRIGARARRAVGVA